MWLHGSGTLHISCGCMVQVSFIILCGCMVEVSCVCCVDVWLRYPVCIVWLYVWGTLFIVWLYGWGTLSYTVWLYGWGILCVLCGCMVEVPFLYCKAVWLRYPFYCMAVWLRYPFLYCVAVWLRYHFLYCVALWLRCAVCIVWLYAWGTLFILCGSVDEVCCLYCVAVWLKYPDCIVWLYVLRYLDFRAQTMYCNSVLFLCETSCAFVGIAVYSGLYLFLHPFHFSSNYSLSCFSFDTHNSLSWCHVSQVHRTGNEGLCKYGVTVLFYPNFTAHCWYTMIC